MRPLSLKTVFLALTVALASATGGVLTACSTAFQNQNAATISPVTDADGMNHKSDMEHGMAVNLGAADASYDLRFIDAMTVHHQGAVSMAHVAQQKSQRPEIKQLADNIIKTQNKEIEQMKQWRQAWYPQASIASTSAGGGESMSENLGAADAEFDLRFINDMIAHHEGALTMAQDALSKSKRPEIEKFAQQVITAQEAEIKQMKQWRQAWYQK